MEFQNIKTTLSEGIFQITINRPDKLNALNRKTIAEIGDAIKHVYHNEEIKSVLITGAGEKAFVAGADISEFVGINKETGSSLASQGQEVFLLIEQCPKPVVAAVNGFALGGGCELAMACHLRIASENAKFGQPEVKLGLIPGYGGTQRLIQYIGKTKAIELLMTADMITAEEALSLGLVNYVTPSNEVVPKATELLKKIMQQAPRAIAGIINSVNGYFTDGIDGFKIEIEAFGTCCETEDFKEGTSAFLEKRKPSFQGK